MSPSSSPQPPPRPVAPRPVPIILAVEPDDQVRPCLVHNLQQAGYAVIVSLDSHDASARVREGRLWIDLILLNQMELSLEQILANGRSIRQQTANGIPPAFIVVIAERYGVDLEGQDVLVGEREYITYLEDGLQLMRLLQRLCPVGVHGELVQ